MNKPAWSYSALSAFELCPKQYYHYKIARDIHEKSNAMADYGSEAHKRFEQRMVKGKTLPLDLRHHEKVLKRLHDAPGENLPEQKLALNSKFQPTGFFDSDVWCRGIIDYTKPLGTHAVLADWKFGRQKDGFDQLDLMATLLFIHMPELETIKGLFYWAKDKQFTTKDYVVSDTTDIWAELMPRVNRMFEAIELENFPARKNFLCRRHCAVRKCPYWGE